MEGSLTGISFGQLASSEFQWPSHDFGGQGGLGFDWDRTEDYQQQQQGE